MENRCLVCNDSTPLHQEGIFIQGNFLCQGCEDMIVSIKTGDIYYPFVKNSLKKLWCITTEKRYVI